MEISSAEFSELTINQVSDLLLEVMNESGEACSKALLKGKDRDGNARTFTFGADQEILLLRVSTVFNIVASNGRLEDNANQSTIVQNLESHPSYLGTVATARFKWTEIIEKKEGDKVIKDEVEKGLSTSAVLLDYRLFLKDYTDFRRGNDDVEVFEKNGEQVRIF